ncbi:protein YLS3 isoform X2 [Citrus clementina]|uniref:protein YLS3 isoform X2 n=1 Tax=Citrus clementina TaxID=85681 RepID=UPI000CED6631|nr:protein YLS3 isoform X2 [Citrus x clementina]
MHVTTHTRKNALSIYISPSKPQFLPPGKPHTNTFAPLLISLNTPHHSMALLHSLPAIVTAASLITLLAIALPHPANSQAPTITSCISHLLPLSPCVPFVQGKAQTPAQTCCINLQQVYTQKPRCLCLLVNGTAVGNMPINSTLATRLPAACNLKVDASQCSVPPSHAGHQVSLGSNTNATIAASPMVVPGASTMASSTVHGCPWNAGAKLNTEGQLAVMAAGFSMFALYYA